jgi:hypothetical protein
MVALAAGAEAAPVTLTLQQTTVLYNVDPPGAPLPLTRIQYSGGNVLLNNQKIGEYLWIKDVHAAGMNTAAVRLTLFFPNPTGGGAPVPITLEGSHDFTSGNGMGSISASFFSGLVGITYTSTPGSVTLNLP